MPPTATKSSQARCGGQIALNGVAGRDVALRHADEDGRAARQEQREQRQADQAVGPVECCACHDGSTSSALISSISHSEAVMPWRWKDGGLVGRTDR